MRIRIPKKYQARLSKVYLDCAEMLPRFGGGPISTLQLHREHQREDAEDTYQRTRLPEGIKVQYLFFRLFELFQIEDFEQLQKLLGIFPPRDIDSENDNLSRQLI